MGQEAIKYLPDDASLHFNLGNALGKDGRYVQSEHHFLEAVRLAPKNGNYYSNLGVFVFICPSSVQGEFIVIFVAYKWNYSYYLSVVI